MDFHALPRRDLQALCKRNGVRANMTNAAMAEALAALPAVDGIEEFVKQPAALQAPATEAAVSAVAEEDPREKKGSPLPRGRRVTFSTTEVINLDGSDEEGVRENKEASLPRGRRAAVRPSKLIRPDDGEQVEKQGENGDENAPALGEGRRGASRRARADPVVAPTTRRRAASSKVETDDVPGAVQAPPVPATRRRAQISTETAPAPTTRRRAQTTVAAQAEEKVTRGRRTTRRAAERKHDIQQEEEECIQGVVPDVQSTEPVPVSQGACNDTDKVEETGEFLAAQQESALEKSMQEEEEREVEVSAETVEAVTQECSADAVLEDKPVQEEEEIEEEVSAETVDAVAQECSADAVLEDKPVREEEEIEVEVPTEAVEAVAPVCSDDVVLEDKPVQEDEEIEVEVPAETVEAVAPECSDDVVLEDKSVQEDEEVEVEVPAETVEAVAPECSTDAVLEEKLVQEEEGLEMEAPAETVEALAQECSPDSVVEEKQVAVEVEQLISLDDSPILGLVSGTGQSEEAAVCNSECRMDILVTEESSDTVCDDKEALSADDEALPADEKEALPAQFLTDTGDAKEEEDEMEAVDEACFAAGENGAETVDELNDTLTEHANNAVQLNFSEEIDCADEEAGVVATDGLLQSSATVVAMVSGSVATEEAEFSLSVGHGSDEEDALEAINGAGFTVGEKGVETADEPYDTLSNAPISSIQPDFSADTSCAVEGEGVEDLLQSTETTQDDFNTEACHADEPNELVTVKRVSSEDDISELNVITGDLTLMFHDTEELGNHINSVETADEPCDALSNAPLSSIQLDFSAEETTQDDLNTETCHAGEPNELVTVKRVSSEEAIGEVNVTTGDHTLKFDGIEELRDHITSVVPEGVQTLPLFTEMLDNVNDLSLGTVTDVEAMVSEVKDVSSDCVHGSNITKRSTELSAMENGDEVKVVEKKKEPVELAKLSLRILKAKLKEKLTAKHMRKEAKRVALGRLDENVC
ncbi:uncharacterized protein LOC102704793 isoform X2 [Oryza brachyantha]|uniref:uncharacterized protein LOC102704793 isoform X2 n=1 Tax=Oryza brachyantha TaxID=4533 RepID=UPI001ADB4CC2|nr:uncharacterized protein LOC102704793 isoform X2 [Oryza brachyantha]